MASASVTERKRNNCVSHNASGARETAAEQPSQKRPDFRVCELPVSQNRGKLRGELPVLQNRGGLRSELPVLQNRGGLRSELPALQNRGRLRREFTELWERRKGKTA